MRHVFNASPKIRGSSAKKFLPPLNFWSILHNFRLWSRISPEWDKISKIGKMCDLERFLLRSPKEVRWTLVHYPQSSTMSLHPPQVDFFRQTIFQPLGGVGHWNFYTRFSLTKACYRTPQTGSGVSQKISFKIGLKIPHRSAYNFGSSGRNLAKLYQWTWLEAGVIMWTLILEGVPPTKFGRAKNVKNSARFLTTFDFDREYLRNVSTHRKSEKYLINYISSPIGWKNLVNLCPLTTKL